MKARTLLLSIAAFASLLYSCDDNTDNLGGSIIDDLDNMKVYSDYYPIESKSVKADSIFSRTSTGYLGKIKDSGTGAYVKEDFLTQFYTLEGTQLPKENTITSRLKDGSVIADSCVIYLYYDKYYGDSLATMKLNMSELSRPLEESEKYYTDFNPQKEGDNYCRTGKGMVSVNKTYSLYDLAADTVPKKIKIKLPNAVFHGADSIVNNENAAYIDKDGNPYFNYGTYLMQKYYSDPSLYKNAYSFIHNVCPGFYIKSTDGLGSMAYINMSQMLVYYKYKYQITDATGAAKDTVSNVVTTFAGTEEVMQTTSVVNDEAAIGKMISDNSCTYAKSPSGIFTELAIPVDDILKEHENDTINSARITLTRINNSGSGKFSLNPPATLLLIPNGMRTKFFENGSVADNLTSYIAVSASDDQSGLARQNSYTFHNVANLIKFMNDKRNDGINEIVRKKGIAYDEAKTEWEAANSEWNKALVIPVETTYVTIGQSSQLVKVANDMSLTETKFVRGTPDKDSPIKIEVIYSKFQK